MHEQILDALRRGAHDEALAAAAGAIEADPRDVFSHRLMAQALRAGGDHQAALESIDRAIAIAPDDADLHFHRAGLLLGSREVAQARQALDQAIGLDPNQLGAYVMQAELALGRGDFDEAERLARVADRIVPEHPLLLSIEAMVALGRGDRPRALARIAGAQQLAPNEPRVLNAAGFIYLANENFAFAEQAFRRLRELKPEHHALGRVLAELLYRQGRLQEALEEIESTLGGPQPVAPESLRFAGELALRLRDPQRALRWLRGALAAMPADARALDLAMQSWSLLGDAEGARNALEALLSTSAQEDLLWRARLSVETNRDAAGAVIERWMAALPDSVEAHRARLNLQLTTGDVAAAEATARRIIELDPGHLQAHGSLLDLLMLRDRQAAVRHAQALLERTEAGQADGATAGQAGDAQGRQRLARGWLARTHDGAGNPGEAAKIWAALHAEAADRMIPPPPPTAPDAPRKPASAPPEQAPALAFLAGLPGSGVERVARLLDGVVSVFRADRVGPKPPSDPLQNLHTTAGLAEGRIDPAEVAAQWRQALPARGLSADGAAIDWLLWWDNALLDVIGPHLPQARLLIALRDPRDMLLDWLAYGAAVPLRLESPERAAQWLAQMLEHVAVLDERALHPHALLRLDESINAPRAMAGPVGAALGVTLPEPPEGLFGNRRFQAGHWRAYAGPLAAAFAALTPVAVRLGYPES